MTDEQSRAENDAPAQMPEEERRDDPARIGAFFDVDETLVRGATAYWAAREMFRQSFFGVKDIWFAARHTLRYILFGEGKGKMGALTSRAAQVVAGNTVEDLQRVGVKIFDDHLVPKVYKGTFDLLKQHVEAGHTVYLITATPWILAEELARRLGAAGGIGTKTKVDKGRLVGEIDGHIMHGEAKVLAVLEVAADLDLDLSLSWAYSDSANDIPMLSLVGNPVAVNPDRNLRTYAKKQGWRIFRAYEQRDVVRRWALRGSVLAVASGLGMVLWHSGKKGGKRLRARRTARR